MGWIAEMGWTNQPTNQPTKCHDDDDDDDDMTVYGMARFLLSRQLLYVIDFPLLVG